MVVRLAALAVVLAVCVSAYDAPIKAIADEMVENLDEALAIIEGQIDSKQAEKFEVLSRLQGQIEETSAYVNKTRAKEAALKATVERRTTWRRSG